MAITAGNVVWNVSADLTLLNKGLAQAQKDVRNSMGTILQIGSNIGAGITAASAALIGGLGVVVKASMEAFMDAEKKEAQLDAALRSTGGAAGMTKVALVDLATALSKTSAVEDDAILGAEALMLTFTSVGKDVFPQAMQAVLDMSRAMDQDLKTTVIQVGKALNDPINGMTALRRVGVAFTDEQKDMVKYLVQTGQTMEAQKLILGELGKEFGGSALEYSKTFSGQMDQLKNDIGNLEEKIGEWLLPTMQRLVAAITPVVESISNWIERNPELTVMLLEFGISIGGLGLVIGPILMALPSLANGFAVVGVALAALGGPPMWAIGLIIAAIVALGYAIYENWDQIEPVILQAWEKIKAAFEVVKNGFQVAYDYLAGVVERNWDHITAIWSDVKDVFYAVGMAIWDTLKTVFGIIATVFEESTGTVQEWYTNSSTSSYDFAADIEEMVDIVAGFLVWLAEQFSIFAKWLEEHWGIITTIADVGVTVFLDPFLRLVDRITWVWNMISYLVGQIKGAWDWITGSGAANVSASMAISGEAAAPPVGNAYSSLGGDSIGSAAQSVGTPALASPASTAKATGGGVTINMGQVHINSDLDIREVSKQLGRQVRRELMAQGVMA